MSPCPKALRVLPLALCVLAGCGGASATHDLGADEGATAPDLSVHEDGAATEPDAGRPPPPATCSDHVKGEDETDVDCGGSCPGCGASRRCRTGADCASGACSASRRTCVAPARCLDGQRDDEETDVDCGGPSCAPCAVGRACLAPGDCLTQVCGAGQCAVASCGDGVQGGDETDVDCGGFTCPPCATGGRCQAGFQCRSGICAADGTCAAASCTDGVKAVEEADVDCGGSCLPCPLGQTCRTGVDCSSGSCVKGRCDAVVAPVPVSSNTAAVTSLDTADGVQVWATAPDWSVWHSPDGGMTWARKYDAGPASLPAGRGTIHVGRADPKEIMVYASSPSGSTYASQVLVSHDGMSTVTLTSSGLSTWGLTAAFSETQPKVVYLFGDNGGSRISLDGGDTFADLSPAPKFGGASLFYPGTGAVSPVDPELAWVVAGGFGTPTGLFAWDTKSKTVTDRTAAATSALAGQDPAAVELFPAGAGAFRLRVIGSKGAVATSNDLGATFGPRAAGSLPACGRPRGLASAPGSPDLIATFCPGSTAVSFSRDGGARWGTVQTTGRTPSVDCQVLDVVLVGGRALVACSGAPLLGVRY